MWVVGLWDWEVIESNQRECSGAVHHDGILAWKIWELGLELFIPGSLSKIIGIICKSNHGYLNELLQCREKPTYM